MTDYEVATFSGRLFQMATAQCRKATEERIGEVRRDVRTYKAFKVWAGDERLLLSNIKDYTGGAWSMYISF